MKPFDYIFKNKGQRIVSMLLAVLLLASSLYASMVSTVVGAEPTAAGKVIVSTNAPAGRLCGQNVTVEAGKTYSYSYYYMDVTAKDNSAEEIILTGVVKDGNDKDGGAEVTVTKTTYDEKYYKITYEFIAPENATPAGEGKVQLYLGIKTPADNRTYYFYSPCVYATDDESKTNLFEDASFTGYTINKGTEHGTWYRQYAEARLLNTGGIYYSLAWLEDIGGLDYFKKVSDEPAAGKVIVSTNAPAGRLCGQNVVLEAGKSYTYSYYYMDVTAKENFTEENFLSGVIMDGNGTDIGAAVTITDTIYDDEYYKVTYKFIAPADAESAGEGKVQLYLGIRTPAANSVFYFYSPCVYATDDESKTNLFEDASFTGYTINKGKEHGTWYRQYWDARLLNTGGIYYSLAWLEDIGGLDYFKKSVPEVGNVIYSNGTPANRLCGQEVVLDIGKTYFYSYYYAGENFVSGVMKDGNGLDGGDITPDDVVYDSEYYKVTYKFTAPADATSAGEGKVNLYIGIKIPSPAECYFYSPCLYAADDAGKTNLFTDASFTGYTINHGNEPGTWYRQYAEARLLNAGDKGKHYFSLKTLAEVGGLDFFKKPDSARYALKLAPNSTGMPFFGQIIELEAGETYVFSNYYLPGTECYQFVYAVAENFVGEPTEIEPDNIFEDYVWSKKSTEFTVPDDPSGKKVIWVGFRGYKVSQNLYFIDFELYKKDEPGVNLLKDPTLINEELTVWKSPYNDDIKTSYSKVTLDSIGGMDIFKKPPMVLSLAPNTAGTPYFGQQVSLEPGKTYVFSNYRTPYTDPNIKVFLGGTQTEVECEYIDEDEWSRRKAIFTVPADAPADPLLNGKRLIWVGICGYASTNALYYYDFKLCEQSSPDDNLLSDTDLLENGASINKSVWKTPDGKDVSDAYGKISLASLDGGTDYFKRVVWTDPAALMLDIGVSGQPFFGQNVSLKAGKTYIFSNYFTPYTPANQKIYYAGSETPIDYDIIEDDEYSLQGAKFTVPASAPDDPAISGNKLIWVGIRGNYSNDPLYYYNFRLYDIDDPDTNLLKDPNFSENGNQLNKNVWKSVWGSIRDSYTKVKLADIGGIEIFKKPLADETMVLALAPETTGAPFFGQWVTVEKGETYRFSNYYLEGTESNLVVYTDANETGVEDYDIEYDKEWSKKYLIFTVPKDAPDNGKGQTAVWVGLRGYRYDDYLYYYNFELCNIKKPNVNLIKDFELRANGNNFDTGLWVSPYNTEIRPSYGKVPLSALGGKNAFKRTGDTGPKRMYYTRTHRGPNNETFGRFALSLPADIVEKGGNYLLQFDVRSIAGMAPTNFRCGMIDPALALDSDGTVKPASINGYTYSFNLRLKKRDDAAKPNFSIFVPEGAEGYISNIYLYEADSKFKKTSNRDVFKNAYGDLSQFEAGNYLNLFLIQGACVGTETGLLDSTPQYFFDIPPSVPVPSGDKMMSYASVWGQGIITIKLPYKVEAGSVDGDNYVVSLSIRPTKGRDPVSFYSSGINGELVQVYPTDIDGYKYTFNLTERYDFSLALEFPYDCEGYISNLEMYKADMDFNPVNNVNLATAFGKGGTFADVTKQQGLQWDDITFDGGFTNTFIDTRTYAKQLKNGTLGEYHVSGGIWPIPAKYFSAEKDENWANAYVTETQAEVGTIVGTITDNAGKALEGYTVNLKSMQDTEDIRSAVSDGGGKFRFNSVPVGGYEVSVTTKDGVEVPGDMFVWVEEDKDLVTLSLVFDVSGVDVEISEDDAPTDLIDNNVNDASPAPGGDKKTSQSQDANSLMWILIGVGAGVLVIAAAVLTVLLLKKRTRRKGGSR